MGNGCSFPEVGKLVKLSRLLNCSVDFLLNEDMDEMNDSDMSASIYDAYKFIRECGYFFLATSVDNRPNIRPMGWIYSNDKALFIATDKRKKVYSDLLNNSQIEIASYNLNTQRWIRITGKVESESSYVIYEEMMSMYPIIKQKFIEGDEIFFTVFKVNVENIYIN